MRLHIGSCNGQAVYLEERDMESHLHCMGLSRSGKSKLVLYLKMQLIRKLKALLYMDGHGSGYRDFLGWLVAYCYRQPLVLFNPSYDKRIVGFNPFMTPYRDEARIMTKAERLSQQLMKVFGLENSDQFGNIERILRALFYAILYLELSICDLRYFLYWEFKKERDYFIARINSPDIKADLVDLYSSKVEFDKKIGPIKNKLQRFIHPQMKRIMGLRDNNVNLPTLIEKQRVMFCNLQPSDDDLVGRENMRALGTLLISEVWELFRKRTEPKEFYLIIDEAQEYFTPDIAQILPQSAKRGLHLMIFHQDPGQLTPALTSAVKNAQTKLFFSTEDDLKEQRHFTLRRANGETLECETPVMRPVFPLPAQIEKFVEYYTQYFMTCEQVDERLNLSHNEDNPTEPTQELDPYE
jgi:hypothetical protein